MGNLINEVDAIVTEMGDYWKQIQALHGKAVEIINMGRNSALQELANAKRKLEAEIAEQRENLDQETEKLNKGWKEIREEKLEVERLLGEAEAREANIKNDKHQIEVLLEKVKEQEANVSDARAALKEESAVLEKKMAEIQRLIRDSKG